MSEAHYSSSLEKLLSVMASLRDPDTGCPWDCKQDFDTIVPYTLEECYELADAIERKDFPHIEEELGDVLFQVVFYAQLAKERQLFDFYDVLDKLVEKLVTRHPHVFERSDDAGGLDENQVKQNWEKIKQQERADKTWHGLLDDVPAALPSLLRAEKLQKRAASVEFDWKDSQGPLDKISEELEELQQSVKDGDHAAVEMEVGDLLFSCVNLARHLGVKAENALRRSNAKFENRIAFIEARLKDSGSSLQQASVDEMEQLWQQSKETI
jgi:ATP diphosphatase